VAAGFLFTVVNSAPQYLFVTAPFTPCWHTSDEAEAKNTTYQVPYNADKSKLDSKHYWLLFCHKLTQAPVSVVSEGYVTISVTD
jgi:hypothetical protein